MPNKELKPFLSAARPFAIGLKPLPSDDFLLLDNELEQYIREKRALYESQFNNVCMAEQGTATAQLEAMDLILTSLRKHHGELYDFENGTVLAADGKPLDLTSTPDLPLAPLALLVQDDLVLMRRGEDGWRIAAASLCFPSSWNLQEKFGRPLESVHGPVPMNEKTNERIKRIFDRLNPRVPVWRENWSLDGSGKLRRDRSENSREEALNTRRDIYLRREYQTLHKLGTGGDILFTIRIKVEALSELMKTAAGRELFDTILRQYKLMTTAERRYKGIDALGDFLQNLKTRATVNDTADK